METNTSINHITTPDAKPVLAAALPDLEFGISVINSFNSFMWAVMQSESFEDEDPLSEHSKKICLKIFDEETAYHLYDRFSYSQTSSFFLNLDNENQIAFLNYAFDFKVDLSLPEIPNYKEIGEKYGITDWEQFGMEDIRLICTESFTEWEINPHALVWVRRWLLYSCNNQINDNDYDGEKFGCYPNWHRYFSKKMSNSQKIEFVKMLVSYS